jgi:hypothetical protein
MAEAGRATVGRDFRWVWRAIGVAIVVVVLFWTLDRLTVYWLARSYVGQVAEVFDLNPHLAQAITYAVFSAISVAGTLALSASKSRRWAGLGALLALLILNSLVLWRGTANQLFARSGEAIKCYVITKDAIRYGERAGVDPETGRMCRPVTQEMVERLRAYERGMRPAQILSGSVQFFDPRTGEPTAWHNTATSGQIELYDLMGFHPVTGEELVPVTREIVERWREQDQKRRDEAAERSRRAPQLIDPDKYAFFDPVGGAPRVWFWRGEGGQWEFYDTRGFHPRTGESLTLISRDAIEAWRASQEERRKAEATREKRAPKPVDPERYAFFDAVSGEPRVWFWKSPSSDYEFFDAPGFHPRTGDTLQPITRDVVNGWRQSLEAAKKRAEDESRRAADNERRAIEAASLAQQQTIVQMAMPSKCDSLAANPTDRSKPANVEGMPFESLKQVANEAANACLEAVKQYPNVQRYKYQLARAYETNPANLAKAFQLHQELIQAGYPAAFDNFAGILISRSRDYAGAARILRRGVALQDADSMVSLGSLIESGRVQRAAGEDPYQLYSRAAQLGHLGVQAALSRLDQQEAERGQRRQLGQQQQEFMLEVFKGILNKGR